MQVNFLTILVGAVINMIIGSLWYSQALFGKQWMKLVGKSDSELKKADVKKLYLLTAITALILAYVLDRFIIISGASDLVSGLKIGFWVWLGFVAATTLSDYLFAGRPIKLYYINVGYYLVSTLLMGALLAVWR